MGVVYNTKVRSRLVPAARHTRCAALDRHVHLQAMLFWGVVFFVPPLIMLAFNGGRISKSPEELMETETAKRRVSNRAPPARSQPRGLSLAILETRARPPLAVSRVLPCPQMKRDEEIVEDQKQAMQRALFESSDASTGFRQGWAVKRDQERERRRQEREQAKQQGA
jgi:hypothetical protein